MVQINMVYEGDLHCSVTHAPSGTVLVTDAPKDNQGRGESFSPTDLVASALGTCILTVMGITARTLKIDIQGAHATVEKHMMSSPERRIARLDVTVHMPAGISPEHQQKLEHAAHTCPVHKSLHADIDAPISFVWA